MTSELRVLWYLDLPPRPLAMKTGQAIAEGPRSLAESLRGALATVPGLGLGAVSMAPTPCRLFDEDGVTYYAVPGPRLAGRLKSARRRWSHTSVLQRDLASTLGALLKFAEPLDRYGHRFRGSGRSLARRVVRVARRGARAS